MELRDLRALLAVVRCGSFTAAADELGYTQSAVSQQIASLERELGHRLVHRSPVRPTPAGERLAEHASRVLVRLDVARSELGNLGREPAEFRLGACPLAAPHLLAAALRDVRDNDPSVQVTVRTVGTKYAVEAVAAGVLDAALVDGVVAPYEPLFLAEPGLLTSMALAQDALAIALPTEHPLASRDSIDVETLRDAPWVHAPALGPTSGEVGAVVGRAGRGVVYEGSDLPTLLSLVQAGLGVAMVPISSPVRAAGVTTVPIGHPPLVHRTELITLRTVSPSRQAVIDAFRSRALL